MREKINRALGAFGFFRKRSFGNLGLRSQILSGSAASLSIKLFHTLLSFLISVVLARILGPNGFGVYSFAYALAMLLTIPTQFGLPQLVVRETATAQADQNWGMLRGLWRWANVLVLVASIVILVGFFMVIEVLRDNITSEKAAVLWLAMLLVPLIALTRLRGAALSGLRKVLVGQLPENTLRPSFLLGLLMLGGVVLSAQSWTALHAMAAHVVAAGLAFLLGSLFLRRLRPLPLLNHPKPVYKVGDWTKAALRIALIAGLGIINKYADILMLGILRSDAEVGVYRVVVQGGMLVIFGLSAINMVVMPHFARLHQQGDKERLQRLVTYSARATFCIAIPIVATFIFFGGELLRMVFGQAYVAGQTALSIIALGQLINAAMGSVGMLLNMTGNERDAVKGVAVAAVTNIVLNTLLIPYFGINGAAVATAASLLIWNAVLWHQVWAKLSINTIAFGRIHS